MDSARFWRFTYEELTQRDKANLDIFWLRDESLEDSEDLPPPAQNAEETMEDPQAALEIGGRHCEGFGTRHKRLICNVPEWPKSRKPLDIKRNRRMGSITLKRSGIHCNRVARTRLQWIDLSVPHGEGTVQARGGN